MQAGAETDLIYDVGAHLGEDSAFYLKLGYRVVAVEANPLLADKLRDRFRNEIANGQLVLVEKAIAADEGSIQFFVNDVESAWATTNADWAKRNEDWGMASSVINVAATRFPALIMQYGCPCYLKVDIEGADMLCVEGLRETPVRPTYLSLESVRGTWQDVLHELRTLEALGYTHFKLADQQTHRAGTFKARDGTTVHHVFDEYASGPFGEDAPGKWLSRRQMIARRIVPFVLRRILDDTPFVTKVLPRLPILRQLASIFTWHDLHAKLGTADSLG